MNRFSIKIVGAQGQGVISIGEILAKGLKRSGYCVFGYREYNSVIKGGHTSYQLDISGEEVRSTERRANVLVCLNHHGLEDNLEDLKPGGIIIHDTAVWTFPPAHEKLLKARRISVVYLPIEELLAAMKAKPILSNVLFASFVWAAIGGDKAQIKELVGERFKHKKDVLELNMRCVDAGYAQREEKAGSVHLSLPQPNKHWKDHLLLIGSQAMGLGIVHAGVRLYAGYPMTPSSPLLSYIAEIQNDTGMVIKQAEDEITAAQLVSGAMHVGCRAITATSGGGFDLMSETVSMNGIIENPTVFVLAQRPGPATGLPTWTAQGDLLLAVHTAHGEFTRCVMAVSDSQDCFDLISEAFNVAEAWQTPVIVLTDKQIAEAIYTQKPYDQKKATVRRGKLVTKAAELAKLRAMDRFDVRATNGVSPRWLPGAKAATYNAQADEHNGDGTVDETSENARLQMEKRMKKMAALEKSLPEPELWVAEKGKAYLEKAKAAPRLDLLLVGWGSTKGTALDVLEGLSAEGARAGVPRIGYLHYTYLWPLKTETFLRLAGGAKRVVLIEGNYQGQLGLLLAQSCGYMITDKILQYDGRPFFYDDLLGEVRALLATPPARKRRLTSKT